MVVMKLLLVVTLMAFLASIAFAQDASTSDSHIFAKDEDKCVAVENNGIWRLKPDNSKPPSDVIIITADDVLMEFKLTNKCDRDVFYLSTFHDLNLYGFMIYRNKTGGWIAWTPAWGREIYGEEYRWRPLKPGQSVCSEATDFSGNAGERSLALYYAYSSDPRPDSIIELRAAPFRFPSDIDKLTQKRERRRSAMPSCIAEKGVGYLMATNNFYALAAPYPKISIVLESNGQKQLFFADLKGEVNLRLPVGEYKLLSVLDKDGNQLRTKKKRNGFRIRENRVTRWDLELLPPG